MAGLNYDLARNNLRKWEEMYEELLKEFNNNIENLEGEILSDNEFIKKVERIKDIFDSEISRDIEYEFQYCDNFKYHPNAVDITFIGDDSQMFVSGESVGAGEIAIRKINDFTVKLTGKYNTVLIVYKDMPGMLSQVTSTIQYHGINIASLYCDRNAKGQQASMVISVDGELTTEVISTIEEIPNVYFVSYIEKLEN